MSLQRSVQHYQPTKSQSAACGLGLGARAVIAGTELLPIFTMLLVYTLMMLNGLIEDITEFNHLLSEGAVSESILVNILNFFDQSLLSSQWLIGLYWLLFLYFPARRVAMVLRKTAFAFCETLQSFISLSVHGCRAPPSVNG